MVKFGEFTCEILGSLTCISLCYTRIVMKLRELFLCPCDILPWFYWDTNEVLHFLPRFFQSKCRQLFENNVATFKLEGNTIQGALENQCLTKQLEELWRISPLFCFSWNICCKFPTALDCKDEGMIAVTGHLPLRSFTDWNFSKLLGRIWSKGESVFSASVFLFFPDFLWKAFYARLDDRNQCTSGILQFWSGCHLKVQLPARGCACTWKLSSWEVFLQHQLPSGTSMPGQLCLITLFGPFHSNSRQKKTRNGHGPKNWSVSIPHMASSL